MLQFCVDGPKWIVKGGEHWLIFIAAYSRGGLKWYEIELYEFGAEEPFDPQ
jgi:hypothetical protein